MGTSPSQGPSLAQIAAAAKLSRNAVSLALRNSPEIALKTRERVRALADSMGYRPNPLVTALMSQLTRGRRRWKATIACLDLRPEAYAVQSNPILIPAVQGVTQRAANLGYGLDWHYPGRPGHGRQRLHKVLRARACHGVIIFPAPRGEEDWSSLLPWEHYACAAVGLSWPLPDFHRAAPDHYGNLQLAFRKLAESGCRRVGLLISEYMLNMVRRSWLGAYLEELHLYFPGLSIPPFVQRPEELGAWKLWMRTHKPDGLIVHDASSFMAFLETHKLKLPAGLKVVELTWRANKVHPVEGIDERLDWVGSAVVDLVAEQLNNNERGVPVVPKLILIRGK